MTPEQIEHRRVRMAAYRAANPDKIKAWANKYARSGKGRANKKRFVAANRSKVNQQNWLTKWKNLGVIITRPKPDTCECCGRSHKKIVVDHCHLTMRFRGWICDDCNVALGRVQDTLTGAKKLVSYLENR